MAKRNRFVMMKVDEEFFNKFDLGRRKAAERLRVSKITHQNFSQMLARSPLFNGPLFERHILKHAPLKRKKR